MKSWSGLLPPPTLARTYSHPSYADPWECVRDFRAVVDHRDRHPNANASEIATDLELPRSRVRSWLNGSKPDPVRAIGTAEANEWLNLTIPSATFRGFNVFAAWIYSGGSINDAFVPQFTVSDEEDRTILERAESRTDVTLDFIRGGSADKTRELRPVHHASVLGRILTVLGAPKGSKNRAAEIALPEYLQASPASIRREFVQVYTHNRADDPPTKATRTIREERTDRYLESLRTLFESVTGEPVTRSGQSIVIRAAAARTIDSWSAVLSESDVTRPVV